MLVNQIIKKLADGEVLESKYKDHSLKGKLKDFRDCHIEPDLVLIYKKKRGVFDTNCTSYRLA